MTAEEKAWSNEVRSRALSIVAECVRVQQRTEEGSDARRIARNAGLLAMSLMAEASKRLGQADLAADAAGVQAADYDLNALATAAPSRVKE